jgi:amino acid permease
MTVTWIYILTGAILFIGMVGDTITTLYIKRYPKLLYEKNPIQRWFLKNGYFIHEHVAILLSGEIILFVFRDNIYVEISIALLGLLLILTTLLNIDKIHAIRKNLS